MAARAASDPAATDHPGRVVVVGAVNVDLIMRLPKLPAPGQTVLGGQLSRAEGGKGANQAVAAARVGARTYLVGAVGAADSAESLTALAAEGVNVAAVERVAGRTGRAFVLVDDGGENLIGVASGANARLSARHVRAALGELRLTGADVVVLSFEVPAAALRAAVGVAAEAGCQLVVNPAPTRPRSLDLLVNAIATPNVHELASLAADVPDLAEPGTDVMDMATALARHVHGVVVTTLGPDGALLVNPRHGTKVTIPGHRVEARDTTGAGDTFTGVLAASLAAGHGLANCVRRAVAASALAVTADGARAGMPTAAAVATLTGRGGRSYPPGQEAAPARKLRPRHGLAVTSGDQILAVTNVKTKSATMADPISDFFAGLAEPGHLATFEREAATLRFDVADGDDPPDSANGGAAVEHWHVTIHDGDVGVTRQQLPADAIVHVARPIFEAIVTGRLNAQAAFLRGLVICEGSVAALMMFQRCLPGPPSSTGTVEPLSSEAVMAQRRPT
ncbi:MAG TPA: PfkB family carbohydrate kinase [Streptosporangiaceae bacterium]|nr:PfkB family carbohydrate kinase [Streptosporangiaceae bacterium]